MQDDIFEEDKANEPEQQEVVDQALRSLTPDELLRLLREIEAELKSR
jgi:hypothetical protein